MNSKTFYIILFLSILGWQISAQSEFCAGQEIHSYQLNNDPNYKKRFLKTEEKAYAYFSNKNQTSNKAGKFELPVVVHVIHENGLENIPDFQIINAVKFLNQAFENIGYYDPQTGVNTDIQFCLSKTNPDNLPTNGINRIQSPLTTFNYNIDDITLKNLSRWNPNDYINIWVVKEICSANGCGVVGYAYFPSSHGQPIDGIVLEANYMGNTESNTSVLAHEMGHYLGLYHTFQGGCPNNDCLIDGDRVCDTPPDNTTSRVPCSASPNSCSTDSNSGFPTDQPDMINNYMDYSSLECYNAFTVGQTERMHYFIENERFSLLESNGCSEPCDFPIIANFSPQNDLTISTGESLNFTNNSLFASNYYWEIDGQTVSTNQNFSYQFQTPGSFHINLLAENSDPKCRSNNYSITVMVVCSAISDFDISSQSAIIGETINFTNTSQGAINYTWTVNGNIESTNPNFDFRSNFAGIYKICLTASNVLCSGEKCLFISIEPRNDNCDPPPCIEICDNGIDDDGNGLIDCFDDKCGCTECDDHYYAACEDSCSLKLPIRDFKLKESWAGNTTVSVVQTPVVGDLDGDKIPEIILRGATSTLNSSPIYMANEIQIFKGDGSDRSNPTRIPLNVSGNGGNLLVADLDRDGKGELIVINGNNEIIIYSDYNGSSMQLWNLKATTRTGRRGAPNVADFNNDGIPEIYVGNEIFGFDQGFSSFSKLLEGNGAFGRREVSTNFLLPIAPIAADVLSKENCAGDPDCEGLELICGPEVYSVDLSFADGDGFELKLKRNADNFSDGFNMQDGTAGVADMNLDGSLDIVINGSWERNGIRTFGTYIYNPSKEEIYLKSTSLGNNGAGGSLGKVSIGNFYDDRKSGFQNNFPEVLAVAANSLYAINLNQASSSNSHGRWWNLNVIDPSALTGATCFDFNGDGLSEIVYRDEVNFRIIYGDALPLPSNVDSERNWTKISAGSRTGMEHPIVADVDGDGATEIIMPAGPNRALNGTLQVFESAGDPWIPSRPVWNQQQYLNVNINDDLTVPSYQQAHHLVGTDKALNIFLVQHGKTNFPLPDALLKFDSVICGLDSLLIQFEICNTGVEILRENTPITIYAGDPQNSNALAIANFNLGVNLQSGQCISLEKRIKVNQPGQIYILVNSDNSPSPPYDLENDFPITNIFECDYKNNIDSFPGIQTGLLEIELPPDVLICPNEAFTISANSSTKKYRWQDGSIDSTYTIFEEGLYWCCVEDDCGNSKCDSINVLYDQSLNIDLGLDQLICEGDSINLVANSAISQKVKWFPKNEVACDTCQVNIVKPAVKTIYIVVGTSSAGCITVDSVTINVSPSYVSFDTIQFCSGDTVEVEGNEFTTTGIFEIALQNNLGCDSIRNYILEESIDTIFSSESISICNGDTTLVFGSPVFQAGNFSNIDDSGSCIKVENIEVLINQQEATFDTLYTCKGIEVPVFSNHTDQPDTYVKNFTRMGLCDSSHSITLITKDTFYNFETIEICKNEKAEIFGTQVGVEGVFSKKYTASNGCDSTAVVELKIRDTLFSEESISICESDSVLIFGQYESDPGEYFQIFSGSNGCDSISTFIGPKERFKTPHFSAVNSF